LEVCQETNRNFLGVDLTYNEVKEFIGERERERERIIYLINQANNL